MRNDIPPILRDAIRRVMRRGADRELDLVGKLRWHERWREKQLLQGISPDDARYTRTTGELREHLSYEAELRACAQVQYVLLQTRAEFGQAEDRHVREVRRALRRISPLNMLLIERQITHHDQLAVIDEIGRHVSAETKALLHPGTTSYDILDTARAWMIQRAWNEVISPKIHESIEKLAAMAEDSLEYLQVGRTHLQNTSPVPFGATLASYAARLTERAQKCDIAIGDLRGKVSGIVGTGAGIEMVIGYGKGLDFERKALARLGLLPDETATQVTQKERLVDVGNSLTTLVMVLADLANDMRLLYSSAIGEVTSRANAARLGGSSADAGKNNPIHLENICGTVPLMKAGMAVLYELLQTDLQRDLRNSKPARYQPHAMLVEAYETFSRFDRIVGDWSINLDRMAANLEPVRRSPTEAMVTILRGEQWVHPQYGVGHDFVKEMAKAARTFGQGLLEVAMQDAPFARVFGSLDDRKQRILRGELEEYTGFAPQRAASNIAKARAYVGVS